MNAPLITSVVNDIAAAGFRKAPQGWRQHGQHAHPLDIQDMAVMALRARGERATVAAVNAVRAELARDWPVTVEPVLAPAPTSQTLAAEAALWVYRFTMYTLRRDASGWLLDGRPVQFSTVRTMASRWAVAVAEANGLGVDYAPNTRQVLNDLRRLMTDDMRSQR
ncbi:hypothetical protein OG746_29315 [Streptomyces sp. NBC_01016]|uniref:hypothetical protein n=1 Tax=Streptomyces sp. NBC_01016 TaxID=2903720 RepID=UPI00225A5B4F|nr:hypothetical protein [Streptomyces sp. NBC_01016]MCX4832838.1 hypothetical protein [Streptomyces sp. NBC_01016]